MGRLTKVPDIGVFLAGEGHLDVQFCASPPTEHSAPLVHFAVGLLLRALSFPSVLNNDCGLVLRPVKGHGKNKQEGKD